MSSFRRWHFSPRKLAGLLPRAFRFALSRLLVKCELAPDLKLQLKVAETQGELEDCFKLLHDAYVAEGFMEAHPSGMRVTKYHALPSTTTLCAKFDGRVVGTISLIRESVFGFPVQSAFDLTPLRARKGKIAEVSALAVHAEFRNTGGEILFALMKFMYEYCTKFFDTRYLVIAVNPKRIELYESLLFFKRLAGQGVRAYDFANGAPAVGAYLDLKYFPKRLKDAYKGRQPDKNLYHYFVKLRLPNLQEPGRRFFTTNDPVMTPGLLEYFFNHRTRGFDQLSGQEKGFLYSIYSRPEYLPVLPIGFEEAGPTPPNRSHHRFSFKCRGRFVAATSQGAQEFEIKIVDCSLQGFLAYSSTSLPLHVWGDAFIQLGLAEPSQLRVLAVGSKKMVGFYGFKIAEPDLPWQKFIAVLASGQTAADMENASRFLDTR